MHENLVLLQLDLVGISSKSHKFLKRVILFVI